jgi:hypothetical protein
MLAELNRLEIKKAFRKKPQIPFTSRLAGVLAGLLRQGGYNKLAYSYRLAMVALVLIFSGGFLTLNASASSQPGDFLYTLKMSLDRAGLMWTVDSPEETLIPGNRVGEPDFQVPVGSQQASSNIEEPILFLDGFRDDTSPGSSSSSSGEGFTQSEKDLKDQQKEQPAVEWETELALAAAEREADKELRAEAKQADQDLKEEQKADAMDDRDAARDQKEKDKAAAAEEKEAEKDQKAEDKDQAQEDRDAAKDQKEEEKAVDAEERETEKDQKAEEKESAQEERQAVQDQKQDQKDQDSKGSTNKNNIPANQNPKENQPKDKGK